MSSWLLFISSLLAICNRLNKENVASSIEAIHLIVSLDMIQKIETVEDVTMFFNELLNEGIAFHPDNPFENYIQDETEQPFYSDEEIQVRNELLVQAFLVCEREDVDIYEHTIGIFMQYFYKNYMTDL